MRSESRVKLRIAIPDRRELGFWTPPAALKSQRVQPARLSERAKGFLYGCMFVAGVSTVAFFLIKWSAA